VPHGYRYDEIGDAKQAPGVGRSASANCLLRQQHGHNDGRDARRYVSNPRRQRELPRQASIRPLFRSTVNFFLPAYRHWLICKSSGWAEGPNAYAPVKY
jgi:hypothetical protein